MTASLTVHVHHAFQPLESPAICPAELLPGYRARWFGARRFVEAVAAGGQPVQVSSEDPMFLWMLREHAHAAGVSFTLNVVRDGRADTPYAEWELEICVEHHIQPWSWADPSGVQFPPPMFTLYGVTEGEHEEEGGEEGVVSAQFPVISIDPEIDQLVDNYCQQFSRGS